MARLAQEKVIRERQEAVAEVVITTPQYRPLGTGGKTAVLENASKGSHIQPRKTYSGR